MIVCFDIDCKKHSKASDDLEEDSFSDNDKTRIVEFVSNGKVAPPTTFLYMVNVYSIRSFKLPIVIITLACTTFPF